VTFDENPSSFIESFGDFTLGDNGTQYLIAPVGGGADVSLTKAGAPAGPTTFPGWSAIQAEEDGAGGFNVLWEHTNGGWFLWNVDSSGAWQSQVKTTVANQTDAIVWNYEEQFQAYLNGDTNIGQPPAPLLALALPPADLIETNGDFTLGDNGTQYLIAPVGGGADVSLTKAGAPAGPTTFAGWSAIQVEEDGAGGFNVLWEHTNGGWFLWNVDSAGAWQSQVKTTVANQTDSLAWNYEELFQADLNGDTTIGTPPAAPQDVVDLFA
jgi:hypothetical protein